MTLALPLLDAMVPAATLLAQTAATPKPRFFGGFVCHGGAPGYWIPKTANLMDEELPYNYKPLEPYKKQTVIFSGLHSRSAEPPPGATGADHWVAAAFLCANKPKKTAGADVSVFGDDHRPDHCAEDRAGEPAAVDAAERRGSRAGIEQLRRGIQLHLHQHDLVGRRRPQPLPMELNPQVVFERMFGDGSTAEQRAARRSRDRSILDSLGDSLSRLRVKLSASDKRRIDEYVERHPRNRAAAADRDEGVDSGALRDGRAGGRAADVRRAHQAAVRSARAGVPRRHDARRHDDLRPGSTGRTYPASEAPTAGFHGASHHGEDPRRILDHAKINQYHIKQLAYFIEKLAKAEDGDGTLLDHSLVLYGTNMGNSNQHLHHDVPHVLVGGVNGKLKGGRHLAYPSKTVPTGNLLLSILDLYDIHQDSQGDSTGRLENL